MEKLLFKKALIACLIILLISTYGCSSNKDEKEIKSVVQKFWISLPQGNLDSLIESLNYKGRKYFNEDIPNIAATSAEENGLGKTAAKMGENIIYDSFFKGIPNGFKKILNENKVKFLEKQFNYPTIKPNSIEELTAKADIYVNNFRVASVLLDKENNKWKVNVNKAIDAAKKSMEEKIY